MIANFFKISKPINSLVIITLIFLIYTASSFINYTGEIDFYTFLKWIGYFVLVLVILFFVNFIINKNNLTKDNSYALLIFVLLLGMFPFSVIDYKLVILNIVLLIAYRRIYSLRTSKNTEDKLFDSSFWIGIATLIYPWSSLLIILVFIALSLFDKSTWRNFLIPIVGFICPIFIYSVYLIAIDNFILFETVLNFKGNFLFSSYNSFQVLVPLSIITGLVIWSIFPTTLKINLVNNEFKNSWYVIVSHFLLVLLIALPWSNKNGSEFLFLFFPMVIIYTNYLQIVEERWFREVFLYSLLSLTVIVYFL